MHACIAVYHLHTGGCFEQPFYLASACGYGCVASLPDGAGGFTTVELKSNFVGTARDGHVICEARLIHGGRTTQVWDAEVRHEESGKLMALFRCTQSILQPRS